MPTDERRYFAGGPADPLRVEPGRNIVDAQNRIVLQGARVTENYKPDEGQLKASMNPADTDTFVRELVDRYNKQPQLVELVLTALRELSPLSAPALKPAEDLPRIYFHLRKTLKALGFDPAVPGGPAVLEVPPMPEDFAEHADEVEDHWQTAWRAGYTAAWSNETTPDTQHGEDDEDVDHDD